MWPFTKTRRDIDLIQGKLAAKDAEIEAARRRRQERALDVVLREDDAAMRAMVVELAALEQERAVIADALIAAEQRERERKDAALLEQVRAEARARGQYLGMLERHAARLTEIEGERLAEFRRMHATTEKLLALLPREIARDYASRFKDEATLRHQCRIEAFKVSREPGGPGLTVERPPMVMLFQDRATGVIEPFVERLGLGALKRRLEEGPKPKGPKRSIVSPTALDLANAAAEAEIAEAMRRADPDAIVPSGEAKPLIIERPARTEFPAPTPADVGPDPDARVPPGQLRSVAIDLRGQDLGIPKHQEGDAAAGETAEAAPAAEPAEAAEQQEPPPPRARDRGRLAAAAIRRPGRGTMTDTPPPIIAPSLSHQTVAESEAAIAALAKSANPMHQAMAEAQRRILDGAKAATGYSGPPPDPRTPGQQYHDRRFGIDPTRTAAAYEIEPLPEDFPLADGVSAAEITDGMRQWLAALGVDPVLGRAISRDVLAVGEDLDDAAVREQISQIRDYAAVERDAQYALDFAARQFPNPEARISIEQLPAYSRLMLANHGAFLRRWAAGRPQP